MEDINKSANLLGCTAAINARGVDDQLAMLDEHVDPFLDLSGVRKATSAAWKADLAYTLRNRHCKPQQLQNLDEVVYSPAAVELLC